MIQNTENWIEFRRSRIGASDAPIIMGVSPWKTPLRLWEEKMGFVTSESNQYMRRGLELEEAARKQFEELTGIVVFPEVMVHPEFDWMIASLDGIDIEHTRIVEIKCPGKIDHESAMDGVIPEKYIPQLQHQMIVTGLDCAFYFSYNEENCKLLEISRCKEYENKLLNKELCFLKCMVDLEPPEPVTKDFKIRNDEIWQKIADDYVDIRSKLQILRQREEELRQSLIHLSGGSNVMGAGIKLSKQIRRGQIDYKTIPEIQNMNLENMRKKPVEIWRIEEL